MKTTLVIINILLMIALAVLFMKGKFWGKAIDYIHAQENMKNAYSYDMNKNYKIKSDQYLSYDRQANIVMFGNSLTEMVEWNELLGRDDIVNRGIGSDITEGMLNRIESVFKVTPEICFFMGGTNDFIKRISYSKTISNIEKILSTLKNSNVKIVIQSVLFTNTLFEDHKRVNTLVSKINLKLNEIAKKNDIVFLDLNQYLSKDSLLKSQYTYDGLHLNSEGYKVWGNVISETLEVLSE